MTISSLGTYFLLFFFLAVVASVSSEDCSYTLLVKTGTEGGGGIAGTDAKISVILKDVEGSERNIPDLELHGKMGSGHNYFQSRNLDSFRITTTCMKSPVCSLTLSSDNSGNYPSWYVDYVQVLTSKGSSRAPSDNIIFEINGWLAKDHSPQELTRTFNMCCP